MVIYILVNLLVIFFGTIVSSIIFRLFSDRGKNPPKSLGFQGEKPLVGPRVDISNNYIFFILCAAVLLFITVFRSPDNGLSVDYPRYLRYSDIFSQQGLAMSLENSLGIQMENGLILLMTVLAPIVPDTILPFIFLTALLSLIGYFFTYRKYSPIVWLSVLCLVSFGSYYVIFNGIAQAFAIGLAFGASKYLYERGHIKHGFLKYVIIIALVSLFHKSVLLLIPFYFILTRRFNWARGLDKLIIVVCAAIFLLIFAFPDLIVNIGMNTLFTEYQGFEEAQKLFSSGTGLQTILRPLLLLAFLVALRRYINMNDKRDVVGVNAVLIFSAINILSLQVAILQRLSYLFIPFITVLIPLVISRMPSRSDRMKWLIAIVTIFLLYGVASTAVSGDLIFKFYWQQ